MSAMKLYELTNEIRELFSTEELDVDKLEALEIAFADKVESCCAVIREAEGAAATYKAEIDRLAALKRATENRAEWLKDYVRTCMEGAGETKINGRLFNVTLGKPTPVVSITGTVPEEYQVVKYSDDKTAIGRALKAGEQLPFAELVDGKAKLIIK